MTASAAGASAVPPRPRVPWLLLGVTVVLVVAMLVLSLGREELYDTLFYGALALALGVTGSLVASRNPTNPLGWLFCAMGIWGGLTELWEGIGYWSWPVRSAGVWWVGWSWVVDLSSYVVVFLLFPTGRLLTRRWRWVVWAVGGACALAIPGQALNPETQGNPLAVDSAIREAAFFGGMTLLLLSMGGAVASLALRYRRAEGVERLQLRQLLFAGSVFIPIMVVAIPFYYDSVALQVTVGLGLLALPVSAGLAILRYRLYDIDVVINRTLVYGSLSALLAATYVGSVLLLQVALSGLTEGSGLAVATSTLAVAALFRPARARIQKIVDRRFFRSRYDATRTLQAFGDHLRDQVDLNSLRAELESVVLETMRPAHVTLWVRDQEAVHAR